MRDTLLQNRHDSDKFWSAIRNARSKPREQPPIEITTWKEHFEKILGQANQPDFDHEDTNDASATAGDSETTFVPELDEEISEAEVKQAIRKLKPGKASGLDEVSSEFLKSSEHFITPFLTKLFNKLYDEGYFPEDWTRSVIVPLFKKGDTKNPGNYRGISLLSVISKFFTSILNSRLYQWAENEEKICEEQAGFRKGYSTIDHV